MQSLIIHIGAHKTGSTAIQRMLIARRPELAAAAIHYPEIGFSYYGHHALHAALEKRRSSDVAAIAAELNALDGEVVLSSENFCRSDFPAIETLAASLKAEKVRIVYYQRNFLDMVYVWWQERIKHGSTQTFLAYYAECLSRPFSQHILNAPMLLDRWGKAFGREAVEIYLYDEIANAAEHFLIDILGLIGVKIGADSRGINKSFDVFSTEFIRCLNLCGLHGVRVLLDDGSAKPLRDKLRAAGANQAESLEIDYANFIFGKLEAALQSQWGDRIINRRPGEALFRKRSRKLAFIDSSFWFGADELAAEIRAFANKLKGL